MKGTNTSAPSAAHYLPEDLGRLLVTIAATAIICGAVFWLESKTHFLTRLFAAGS